MLPLVRQHEYMIIRAVLSGAHTISEIETILSAEISEYDNKQLEHALEFMLANGFVHQDADKISLDVPLDENFREYLDEGQSRSFDLCKR